MSAWSSPGQKIRGRWLHKRCINASTSPVHVLTPDLKLSGRVYRINLHYHALVFNQMRPAQWWKKRYHSRKWTYPVSKPPQHSSFAIHKFCTASEEHCGWGYRLVCVNFCYRGSWSASESLLCVHELSEPTFIHMVGSYIETSKTTRLSKFGHRHLHRNGCLIGTIQ